MIGDKKPKPAERTVKVVKSEKTVSKRCVRLMNGDVLLIPPAAGRALEQLTFVGDGPFDVVLNRTGADITTIRYDAYVKHNDGFDDCRELGILRGKADFSEVAVHTPKAAVCSCDIRDLMSTGHTPSCPEKRK